MVRNRLKSLLALCLVLCMALSLIVFTPRASAAETAVRNSDFEAATETGSEPEPVETEAAEPEKTEPEDPEETEPEDPEKTEPEDPEKTEPEDPEKTEPEDPEETEETEPEDPEKTEPEDPEKTEPEETEPEDPEKTEPEETEPEEAEETEEITDEDVLAVIELLKGIDSLQEMQNKRATITVKTVYAEAEEEHLAAQQQYKEYVDGMFEKRAAAKEAYEALSDEQKEQVQSDEDGAAGLAKLDPYDSLPNIFPMIGDFPLSITPSSNEYCYEVVRAYELSQNITADKDFPCTIALVDVSGDATSWTPNAPYQYGQSNYEITYCIDLRMPTTHGWHYKRVNLEDCDYYTASDAAHIRAIILTSYPFISMDQMKSNLIAGGFNASYANALTRSDMIAAVQQAIWAYANRSNMDNITASTTYGGTAEVIDYPYPSRRLIKTMNDYRGELWDWYNTGFNYAARYPTIYADTAERVNALTQYLCNLPGVEPQDDQIIITEVSVARSDFIEGSDDTYSVDLRIFLNHGTAEGDITIVVTSSSVSETGQNQTSAKTIQVNNASVYETTITAKYGDTVMVVVDGTQTLPRGVYFYEPEGGFDKSQALVGLSEGETRVHAETSFVFDKDIDMGLRVYKVSEETKIPISDISFDVYRAEPEDGTTLSGKPTDEEIAAYATEENLVGTITTDSTGYGFLELPRGTFLVIERSSPKVKAPADPFYVTIPSTVEVVGEDGSVMVVHQDIVAVVVENIPFDTPDPAVATPEVTKAISGRDWNDDDSFSFLLEAVTEGAPMPEDPTAVATKASPIAVFGSISYKKVGTYEYRISELSGTIPGMSYDITAHQVVVTVKKATDGSNKLVATVSYDGASSLTVSNSFEPVLVAPEVTKEIEGRDWGDRDSFTFRLQPVTEGAPMPANETAVATRANPVAVFGSITYEKVGSYEYYITEDKGELPGMSYDIAYHQLMVTVSVAEDGSNRLVAELSYDGTGVLLITNRFTPAEVVPEVTKLLDGRDWNDDDTFTFLLEAVTKGAPLPEDPTAVATKASPVAVFDTLSFSDVGVYEYRITEVDGGIEGVTYDISAHKVIVTVTKDESGSKLVASISYDEAESLTVTNSFEYPAPTEATPEVTKALVGRDWNDDDEFTFRLDAVTEGAPLPETVTAAATKAARTAVFGSIRFDAEGTYEYTITEIDGGIEGVTYDISAHKVTVTVTKDENEYKLVASVSYDGAESLTVTNRFENPTPAEATPEVTKAISGRDWNDDDTFTFRLDAVTEGAPLPATVTAVATKEAKTAVFGSIRFDAEGTYEYTITELDGGIEGVTYDISAHKVTVTVTKDETEYKLVASVSYDGAESLTVTNVFENPTPAEATPEVTKAISGRDWNDDDSFTFKLEAVTEGAPMPEKDTAVATKDAKTAVFGSIRFDTVGTYVYRITEVAGSAPAMTYDLTAHQLVITVSRSTDGSNKLVASLRYEGAESLTVTNTYQPVPTSVEFKGTKTISGKTSSKPTFSFTLVETTPGANYKETVNLKGSGSFQFKTITYDKPGIHTYEITEVKGSASGWIYDTKKYTVTVTVTADEKGNLSAAVTGLDKDGTVTFKNTYDPSKPPTGDDMHPLAWGLSALASFTALVYLSMRLKKRHG